MIVRRGDVLPRLSSFLLLPRRLADGIADPTTVGPQIKKLREQFGLMRVAIVGDRGMITHARIREELRGVDSVLSRNWIALKPVITETCRRGRTVLTGVISARRGAGWGGRRRQRQ